MWISHVTAMLETYLNAPGEMDPAKLAACIGACVEGAQACTVWADAGLSEEMVARMIRCIRTNVECGQLCEAIGRVLWRHTGYDASITFSAVPTCWMACKACSDECEQHAFVREHCRVCAQACRRCEAACAALIAAPLAEPAPHIHPPGRRKRWAVS